MKDLGQKLTEFKEKNVPKIKEKVIDFGYKVLPKAIQLGSIFLYYKSYYLGLALQRAALFEERNYDIFQGHLCNFAVSGFLTSLALLPAKKKAFKYKLAVALIIPSLLSGVELTQPKKPDVPKAKYEFLSSHNKQMKKEDKCPTSESRQDPWDILTYYLASLGCLGLKELTERKIKRKNKKKK